LQFGDIVFHRRGEQTHLRTNGESQWGLISLPHEQLAACANALTGLKISSPPESRVLRPSRSTARRFVAAPFKGLSSRETRHKLIANPEVARALEQELLHALVNCLTAGDANANQKTRRNHTDIMVRFEDALAANKDPQPERARAMAGDRRTGANVARMLH